MLTVREASLLALLALCMTGCRSGPPPGPVNPLSIPSHSGPTIPTAAPEAPLTTNVVAPDSLAIAPPAPLPTVDEPAAVVQPTMWLTNRINAWVPLGAWGAERGFGQLVRINNARSPAYEFRGTNGTVGLRLGSRIASCDGLEYWLGYAPQIINGLPHVHLLDALKNLQPLLGLARGATVEDRTIVIDPGHGGRDVGSRSVFNGTYEKEYTVDWALRLGHLLAAKGWKVYLTRTNDATVPLPDRVGLAAQVQASLFVSLHFNSGLPNRELAGIETYCLTPAGLPSNLLRNYEDDPRQVFPNNAFDEQNLQFALGLHRSLIQGTGATDRGVRRARFMGVLRPQNRPSVLIEGGYLTNLQEARRVATPAYRQSLAEAVARALN